MWFIKVCDDYHEIRGDDIFNDEGDFSAIELGCYPHKHCSCDMYFGLFFRGRKPSLDKIIKCMLNYVPIGQVEDPDDGRLDLWTVDLLKKEVKLALSKS